MLRHVIGCAFILAAIVAPCPLSAQGVNVEFGQNRVQYHDFDWQYQESENFITYYYPGGQDIGRFAVQIAEQDLDEIEQMLDYKITSRIEVLVYNDVTDLNQSNIGVGMQLSNIGGVTQIIGSKVFIYFTGDHLDLRRQIREGIAMVLVNHMMFGGNVQEVLQNAVLLNLPEWFVNGLVAYIGSGWNSELDSRMRDGILSGEFRKFNRLQAEKSTLAGQSFWYYVSENFGKEAVPNLLYLTRINRSLENGFLFVLGYPYRLAIEEWYHYFKRRYEAESVIGIVPEEEQWMEWRQRKDWTYSRLRTSPGGKFISYAGHRLGEWKVWLREVETGETKVIAKGGFKTKVFGIDKGYPLVAFDPTGQLLAVAYEKRDVPKLMTYDLSQKEREVRDMVNLQRITDISFADNRRMLMSAINRGQSDIFTYNVRTRTIHQITNDFYDDLSPAWVDLGTRQGIVFASNRSSDTSKRLRFDTTLPTGNYDIYFYNELRPDKDVLVNLTNTPHLNETYPMQIDGNHFTYLSDVNGIYNRHAGYIDSILASYDHVIYYKDSTVINPAGDWDSLLAANRELIDSTAHIPRYKDTAYVFAVTNLSFGILEQNIDTISGISLDLMHLDGRYAMVKTPLPDIISEDYAPTLRNTEFRNATVKAWSTMQSQVDEPRSRDPVKYFQSGFDDSDTTALVSSGSSSKGIGRVSAYHVKFSTDYVMSQFDNSLIFTQYESFVGSGPIYQTPSLSGMITLGISDLFKDYRISGGFRIPSGLGGSEYFLAYENMRKRLDKKLMVYRKVETANYDFTHFGWFSPVPGKNKTHYIEASGKYPIDILRSVRVKLGYRSYRVVPLSIDIFSNQVPFYGENWLSARAEYVFDNTYEVMLNILNGTRYKFYAEAQKQFGLEIEPELDVSLAQGILTVLGFDARHYQKVHRQIIWANRIAGSTSNGNRRVMYYLGGVDNWLIPKFDEEVQDRFESMTRDEVLDLFDNYAFQALATNMRGFKQGARYGNSYVVINSELRIPVFSYLINAPIRSQLIRNFQIVGFGDIGTAWEGFSPFAQDNPFNSVTISNGPVTALVRYFRDPVIFGYGVGARSLLLGYFVRVDVAWGLDTGVVKKRTWYLSLSKDF